MVLSTLLHDWSKSLVPEITSSVADFITKVMRLINPAYEAITESCCRVEKDQDDGRVTGVKRQSMPTNSKTLSKNQKPYLRR